MTARPGLRLGRCLREWSAVLALTGALLGGSAAHAQEPAAPGDPRPAPNEDGVDRHADTAPATPRPPSRRRPVPAPTPVGVNAEGATDAEGSRAALDAGVPSPRPGATHATDGLDAGPSTATAVPPLSAAAPLDGGAPLVSPPDAGAPDPVAPGVLAATAGGVTLDAGAAPTPPPAVAPVPTTTFVQWPAPLVPPSEPTDPWAGLRKIIPGIPTGGIEPLGLLLLLVLLALVSSAIERLRARLLRDGWLPALLSFLQVSARLVGLLLALALVIQVVPADVRWVVYFILMASGAALGWSTRDVMPDLVAGVVIVFERRIRRGVWIRTAALSGAVERVGLRSSWLRDANGDRVAVPNRMLMQNPVVTDDHGATVQEVVVRVRGTAHPADVRRALCDAVLASPWTLPHAEPEVLREPADPELWRVRARLLSASFAAAFQGQLLERAEAHLAARRNDAGPPTLDKSEKPDKTEKTERAPKAP